MPSSYPESIPNIIQVLAVELKPNSVIDIGPGRGKYGLMMREYFPPENEGKGGWPHIKKIDCLEIFEPYITDVHRAVYDNVFIGNALDFEFGGYDLYMMIDVVEHWPKEDALALIERCTQKGKVLVSIPKNVGEQGAHYGNEWERHVSSWTPDDFKEKVRITENKSNHCSWILVFEKK